MEGVSRGRLHGRSAAVGFGYISIPIDVDRDKFISLCYIKERVNIWMADNPTIIRNCRIGRETLSQIEFPETYDGKGSFVVFVTHHVTDKPIVVGVLSREYEGQLLEEKSWKRHYTDGGNMSAILMRGKNGEITLTVDSDKEKGGNVTINVKNKKNAGILDLICNGKVNIKASDDIAIKTSNNIEISRIITDSTGKETIGAQVSIIDNTVSLKGDEIVLSDKTYKAARAEELKTQLDTLQSKVDLIITAINNGIPVTGDGGLALQNSMKLILQTARDADFKDIFSEKIYVD